MHLLTDLDSFILFIDIDVVTSENNYPSHASEIYIEHVYSA